ncbi:UbiD family decarboxylase [Rouxiella sp. Mn2063]|uniref:UbiD family decarboxylase n=1 Tax=Rouxiella sp. Mn2063 TaxID=3395262 RepID=UPI003BC7B938
MNLLESALDLRTFLNELRHRQDLVDVNTEVDANLEIAAIVRRVYEERLSAPLFKNIKGALPGACVLGAPAGMLNNKKYAYSRLALHFGLRPETTPKEILSVIRLAMKKEPLDACKVRSGPVKENIWKENDIDLTRFPVPLLHEKDGGRYIGTYGFHIVRSPDGKWDSWSIGRMMMVDHNKLTGPAISTQHIGMIRDMWRKEGKATPWAFVLGAPPAAVAVAGMPLPAYISEPGYVGALLGTPIDVVKAETCDLWVPANAEIVIEGEISLDETALEGPMGEYHGYQHTEGKYLPMFHVKAITFRNNPILPICVAGLPPEENHTIWGTMISAQILEDMQEAGMPVDMAWCSYEAATCWTVLSVDTEKLALLNTDARSFADHIAEIYYSTHAGYLVPKLLLIGNDIDITNIDEVVWALATRAHPQHDFIAYPNIPGFPMVPYLDAENLSAGKGGNMIINCLFPEQFRNEMRAGTASFKHSYPPELQEKVLRKWREYGFSE